MEHQHRIQATLHQQHCDLFLVRVKARQCKRRFAILVTSLITITLSTYIISTIPHSKHAILNFQNDSLLHIIHAVGKQYQVDITVTDTSMLNCRITCTFFRNQNAGEILECISLSMKAKLTRLSPTSYRINGHGCRHKLKTHSS